tara:strand:- start:102 stop:278 length:177 start_codon:yes stop_codon:yes gene_type:complete
MIWETQFIPLYFSMNLSYLFSREEGEVRKGKRKMKLIIAGSRDINSMKLLRKALRKAK